MEKKKWLRPMLIVLFRGDQSEHVLAACKTGSKGSGVGDVVDRCTEKSGGVGEGGCTACSGTEGS